MGHQILLAGGLTSTGTVTTILSLDPAAPSISPVGNLRHGVHDAAAGEVGGKAFIVGGGNVNPSRWVQSVAADGSVTNVGRLPRARADLSVVTLGDQLFVVGGSSGPVVDTDVLATKDGVHFRVAATLLQGVRYAATAILNGKLYVIGGELAGGNTDAVQVVDLATGMVSFGPPLPRALSHATALVVGGAILVMGGRNVHKASALIQQIDTLNGAVTTVGRLPYKVSDAAGVLFDGSAYLIGGEDKTILDTIAVISQK